MTAANSNSTPARVLATAIPQSRRRLHERRAAPAPAPARAARPHPLTRRNYRVATVAIEDLINLIERCVLLLIPGAVVHARPRMGKTHAIDYAAIHLARHRPDILVLRMSCEHHRNQFEGAFFDSLLAAAGVRDCAPSITDKRFALMCRLSEQLQVRQGYIVVLYCDEAQRLSRHALEWLRDVHDQLGQHGYRLVTFLVESCDLCRYPEETGPLFTEYFHPQAWAAGIRLVRPGGHLWNAFAQAHKSAQLPGAVEIQMDDFTRAIESVLKQLG